MEFKRFILGPLENNCYLLHSGSDAILIDASGEISGANHLYQHVSEHDFDLKGIYITHGHFDHIDAAMRLSELTETEVYLNNEDIFLWNQVHADKTPALLNKDSIQVGNHEIKVLHTPGHTPGSTCYYVEGLNAVFTGDTLFAGGPGATRWNYSSMRRLLDSIENQLFALPENTTVYPGHGEATTIKQEKDVIRKLRLSLETRRNAD